LYTPEDSRTFARWGARHRSRSSPTWSRLRGDRGLCFDTSILDDGQEAPVVEGRRARADDQHVRGRRYDVGLQ
jgi:hypothetical protein